MYVLLVLQARAAESEGTRELPLLWGREATGHSIISFFWPSLFLHEIVLELVQEAERLLVKHDLAAYDIPLPWLLI
jgi:hypothetical protein